jgi:fluoride exporter
MQQRTRIYLGVAAGGALGSLARWAVSLLALKAFGAGFPWGTLGVNVAGSFVIGLYFTLTEPDGRYLAAPAARQFVLAGFCGGFTTFSAFSLETLTMLRQQAWALAFTYAASSVILWLAGVWLGHGLGLRMNRLPGRRE